MFSGEKGDANGTLTRFKDFLVNEGLWENTAILMSSDFGRSLNPNSNTGTDHAVSCAISMYEYVCIHVYISRAFYSMGDGQWGGNYFLIGGNGK